jgi:hypothetical protein
MKSNLGNPPKSPFFKGGLKSPTLNNVGWSVFPPFAKGGSGGIFGGGHKANNSWGKPLW